MKRLIRKASFDYTQAKMYDPEKEVHWSNISNAITGLPMQLIDELTYSLMNFTNNSFESSDAQAPLTVVSTWLNRPELKEQLDAQMMTTLNMGIIPELEALELKH